MCLNNTKKACGFNQNHCELFAKTFFVRKGGSASHYSYTHLSGTRSDRLQCSCAAWQMSSSAVGSVRIIASKRVWLLAAVMNSYCLKPGQHLLQKVSSQGDSFLDLRPLLIKCHLKAPACMSGVLFDFTNNFTVKYPISMVHFIPCLYLECFGSISPNPNLSTLVLFTYVAEMIHLYPISTNWCYVWNTTVMSSHASAIKTVPKMISGWFLFSITIPKYLMKTRAGWVPLWSERATFP